MQIPWSLVLPILHVLGFLHVALVSVLSQEDVVDGAEGGGRDKAMSL